ncbi:MAG: hypothetical protein CBB97_21805 [Candidatus Endolissoclinum sp. TMED37]|nr:MAG: hypothetical protein CBB97_21805 [Candidatus Endolissoclinum sp. TMED37]|tara:strand:- start:82 stop:1635 length:1554 start_codon:yes stop_codon:yes gene_type:complete
MVQIQIKIDNLEMPAIISNILIMMRAPITKTSRYQYPSTLDEKQKPTTPQLDEKPTTPQVSRSIHKTEMYMNIDPNSVNRRKARMPSDSYCMVSSLISCPHFVHPLETTVLTDLSIISKTCANCHMYAYATSDISSCIQCIQEKFINKSKQHIKHICPNCHKKGHDCCKKKTHFLSINWKNLMIWCKKCNGYVDTISDNRNMLFTNPHGLQINIQLPFEGDNIHDVRQDHMKAYNIALRTSLTFRKSYISIHPSMIKTLFDILSKSTLYKQLKIVVIELLHTLLTCQIFEDTIQTLKEISIDHDITNLIDNAINDIDTIFDPQSNKSLKAFTILILVCSAHSISTNHILPIFLKLSHKLFSILRDEPKRDYLYKYLHIEIIDGQLRNKLPHAFRKYCVMYSVKIDFVIRLLTRIPLYKSWNEHIKSKFNRWLEQVNDFRSLIKIQILAKRLQLRIILKKLRAAPLLKIFQNITIVKILVRRFIRYRLSSIIINRLRSSETANKRLRDQLFLFSCKLI